MNDLKLSAFTQNMKRKETDLYQPVKSFLERSGYSVKAEVKSCDLVAMKYNEIIIVELKLSFNLELIFQIADRQKKCDSVYAALPLPENYFKSSKWKSAKTLLRRLNAGLIFVSENGNVQIVFHPADFDSKKSRSANMKHRRAIITEFESRSFDGNTGGCTRKKLMTAYRESCVKIAAFLKKHKKSAPKDMNEIGIETRKAQMILHRNYYGWFDHPEKGIYTLNKLGKKEYMKYLPPK